MSRDISARIDDILYSIDRCEKYAEHLDADDPTLREMAEDAVARQLQNLGEAANHLSLDVTDALPAVQWQQIRGFRNILAHEYFGVDADTMREVIETHLPELADALQGYRGAQGV